MNEPQRDGTGNPFWPCPSFGNYSGVAIYNGRFVMNSIGIPFDTTEQAFELSYALRCAAQYMTEQEDR